MAKAFQRFIQKAEKGSVKKERIRQEKKKLRQETKEFFDKKKAEAREFRQAQRNRTEAQPNYSRKAAKLELAEEKNTRSIQKPAGKKTAPERPVSARPIKAARKAKPELVKPADAAPQGKLSQIPEQMPLNKYVAHAGVCSRRDAAELVKSGKVQVNGQVIIEPGFKVGPNDEVKVQGKKVSARKNLVYILLNKPKDYITTMEDPEGRKTVYEIIKHATTERVYPIGRLDRNTTGVLLFTNDGDLAQKLSHPSYEVKKIYEVRLDKPFTKKDFDTMLNGITLEDGHVAPDSLAYADARDKSIIGIEIHSGRNRIVRRMFESLGYDVKNLDRVMFANLTKKNVERGKYRYLSEKEVRLLKFMNASYAKKKSSGTEKI